MLRAGEDYLESILQLERAQERTGVRITDIARKLGVTKPSVIRAMKQLHADGYIEQESYGDIYLTEKGRVKASQVYHRHSVLTRFFRDVLGVDAGQAEKDAWRSLPRLLRPREEKIHESLYFRYGGCGPSRSEDA